MDHAVGGLDDGWVGEFGAFFVFEDEGGFQLPELAMLAKAKPRSSEVDAAALRQNARLLESVLAEFGVKGQIDQIRPGPVVTMYELVPAPGVKTARVVALAKSPSGIPPTGAVTLLRNDPLTQGPKIFAKNCASCPTITYTNHKVRNHGTGNRPACKLSAH